MRYCCERLAVPACSTYICGIIKSWFSKALKHIGMFNQEVRCGCGCGCFGGGAARALSVSYFVLVALPTVAARVVRKRISAVGVLW